MLKTFYIFFIILLLLTLSSSQSRAIVNPLERPNNKYGIHIIDENDLSSAAALVNSSGGDYGYVTLVIHEDDRNLDKWNHIFTLLNNYHLIPLLRLATSMEGNSWKKPDIDSAKSWADFLSALTWFTKNRYVIIFNEPNHAKEWGGQINPSEYARVLKVFSSKLKLKSDDFFVLPAGLDASAPNSRETMDEIAFLKGMFVNTPDVFNSVDGWTSHSYPNPGFTGIVNGWGRGTLRTYLWEKQLLKSLNVNKNLPVFITETGWPHKEGSAVNYFYDAEKVADLIFEANNLIWSDPNIVALTPFVLSYQAEPFANFSWQKPGSDQFYSQFDVYQSIPKRAGEPELIPMPTQSPQVLGLTTQKSQPIELNQLEIIINRIKQLLLLI